MKKITTFLAVMTLSACQTLPSSSTHEAATWQAPSYHFDKNMTLAEKIAHVALSEHKAWHSPFIDERGRLVDFSVMEAEHRPLTDGTMAWQRVMTYWQDSGALATLKGYERLQCQSTGADTRHNSCRYFVTDVAWSASFISYVMVKAGVPDFAVSARHFDYLWQAHQGQGAYRLLDPVSAPLQVGDMLCYVRGQKDIKTHQDFLPHLQAKHSLPAHCDIVVQTHDTQAWLVGGNVINGVTLRKMPTHQGHVQFSSNDKVCTLYDEQGCGFNHQAWVALLKLQP